MRVGVLGGGPSGLTAAWELAKRGFDAVLFESSAALGGNTASFEISGVNVDYGSHRLHPASHDDVLERLRGLLGDDLLERPRHGRIRLEGAWIRFPLRSTDLLKNAPPRFAFRAALDMVSGSLRQRPNEQDANFASVLRAGLGSAICDSFYFPYAEKIWGLAPASISALQAHRRVGSQSPLGIIRRLLPTKANASKRVFYYPRHGFGQIANSLGRAAEAAGATLRLESAVDRLVPRWDENDPDRDGAGAVRGWTVVSGSTAIDCDWVFTTIPITHLARVTDWPKSVAVNDALGALTYRSMVLIYVELDQDQYTPYDAHYFPEREIAITRLSEPKNYAARRDPEGVTVLCAELPCQADDEYWRADDDALGALVLESLQRAGLPKPVRVRAVHTRRARHAYPLYPTGVEAHFEAVDTWMSSVPRVQSFGRLGLFAHDNTHHTMYMAMAAVRCLREDGTFDAQAWSRYRAEFATHVVED